MTDRAPTSECTGCHQRGDVVDRRAFVRTATALAASLAALGAADPSSLLDRVPATTAVRTGDELSYPIPITDGVAIDKSESVIVARWRDRVYAFSLACPHQNTAIRWESDRGRFQCPKHHSKYEPDGAFIEGRATRSLDRFAVRRDGDRMRVDVDRLFRQDEHVDAWQLAFIQL